MRTPRTIGTIIASANFSIITMASTAITVRAALRTSTGILTAALSSGWASSRTTRSRFMARAPGAAVPG